jgi:hypothetical protein
MSTEKKNKKWKTFSREGIQNCAHVFCLDRHSSAGFSLRIFQFANTTENPQAKEAAEKVGISQPEGSESV